MAGIKIKAFAKINLALDVMGKRADGYHEVKMIMQGINLYDLVELEEAAEGISLDCNIPLPAGRDNLAYRAAEMMISKYRIRRGIRIRLHKKIPVEAGLGGGSTDAAAVMLGLNDLCGLGLTMIQLREDAAGLGSDVPFCLLPLTALATGRGEQIEDLAVVPVLWLVLVKPPFGVSTRDAYNNLGRVSIEKRPDMQRIIAAITGKQKEALYQSMVNVLEAATFDLCPGLENYAGQIKELGAKKVLMSGSGPTLLAFADDEAKARQIASVLTANGLTGSGWQVFVTRTTLEEDMEKRTNFYC